MAFANFYKANYGNIGNITDNRNFNGTDRLARLNQTLAFLAANGVANRVTSTAWFYLTPAAWANFLDAYFTVAGINMYLNVSVISAIQDPGCNIKGNKSVPISAYLTSNGYAPSQGVLVDSSAGNINLLNGASDWLQPLPKQGIALDALMWLEARAQYTPPSTAPTPKNPAMIAVPAISALFAWLFV
jgi:hypothetical protein